MRVLASSPSRMTEAKDVLTAVAAALAELDEELSRHAAGRGVVGTAGQLKSFRSRPELPAGSPAPATQPGVSDTTAVPRRGRPGRQRPHCSRRAIRSRIGPWTSQSGFGHSAACRSLWAVRIFSCRANTWASRRALHGDWARRPVTKSSFGA